MKKITSEGDCNFSENREEWQRKNIDERGKRVLKMDEDIFLHQALSTPCLSPLKKSYHIYIEDEAGKKYMDFHGNNVHQLGYGNEKVKEAIREQMESLPFSPRRFTNREAIRLGERLAQKTEGKLTRVLFSPGATTSVGMAMKLARIVTGRDGFLSFWDSFHGASIEAISLGGTSHFRNGIGSLLPGCEHIIPYSRYREIFSEDIFLQILDTTLEKHGDIAGLIMETVRNTEVEIPSQKLMKGIREICTKHGTLLILDETAIALGRTGKFFAYEHYGIQPDMVILGKGLGGGIFPISALLTKEEFNSGDFTSLGHYTHEKSSVGSAAANAVIDFIDDSKILERVREIEGTAVKRLERIKEKYSIVGDIRIKGALFAIELVKDRKTKEKFCEGAENIMYYSLEKGVSFKVSGGNILTLSPPLIISDEELENALDIIESGIELENRKYKN